MEFDVKPPHARDFRGRGNFTEGQCAEYGLPSSKPRPRAKAQRLRHTSGIHRRTRNKNKR